MAAMAPGIRFGFLRLSGTSDIPASASQILRRKYRLYRTHVQRRTINTSHHHATATTIAPNHGSYTTGDLPSPSPAPSVVPNVAPSSLTYPLNTVPFSSLLRGYFFSAMTSSPLTLKPSITLLRTIAYTKSPFLSATRNPLVKWALKQTVYAQFCAGEDAAEVKATIAQLKSQGVDGVLLGCGKELEVRTENAQDVEQEGTGKRIKVEWEVKEWEESTLQTIEMCPAGDFVSIKLTGAGPTTRHHLMHALPPPPSVAEAFRRFVSLARSRRVSLGIDAEQTHFQAGIDGWVLEWAGRYNRPSPNESSVSSSLLTPASSQPNYVPLNETEESYTTIYNTYQAYLLSTPSRLARHLTRAQREDFTLGIKLVRGAYLASEPRGLIWPTKEKSDEAYDQLTSAILQRQWKGVLGDARKGLEEMEEGGSAGFPRVTFLLATHNLDSVRKVLELRKRQVSRGEKRVPLVYAQLFGMADYVTGEMVEAASRARAMELEVGDKGSVQGLEGAGREMEVPKVWKYLVWGGVGECAKYLVRRAEENGDAVSRTGQARREFGMEICRRLRGVVSMGV